MPTSTQLRPFPSCARLELVSCHPLGSLNFDEPALMTTHFLYLADDDGSAVTVLVTAFEALLKTGLAPTSRPLELHFYAAEEGGLLGSKAVARAWAEQGKTIHSLLHM